MLKIYNTLDRQLEEFKPIEPGKVRFYQCGPTVYWTQHIGNLRAMTMADLIRRSLIYMGYDVKFVRNYTDVGHLASDADEGEDKMEKGAKREGLTPQQIAQKYIDIFEADTNALNILPPDVSPRATGYVQQMIAMVQTLLDKGFAYNTPGAIYFDVTKFPEYTKMSGQKLEENREGAGKGDVSDEDKHNPADFAVWFYKTRAHKNAIQTWKSPFTSPEVEDGEGFPGWHIECSAMTKAELGNTLDIHMGGVEHIPVHHPNEIAQSEAANGVKFVNYWLHNEHLTIDGGKMAKSQGTGFALSELVEKGYAPLVLRYFFLSAHYRSKQNFTWEALTASQTAYERLLAKVGEYFQAVDQGQSVKSQPDPESKQKFIAALEEDFSIPQALAVAWDVTKTDLTPEVKLATLLDFDQVLGLKLESFLENPHQEVEVSPEAQKLLDQRQTAREARDWKQADALRDQLRSEFNLEVKDSEAGQTVHQAK